MTEINDKEFKILDTLFEAALVLGKKGEIKYYNHHFSVLTHCSPRIINKNRSAITNILQFSNFDFHEFFKSAQKSNQVILSEELKVSLPQSNNEEIDLVLKFTPMQEGHYLLTINDISIEKKLYRKYKDQLQELKETHAQILQADKLVTIGELTANISHEISNPLTIASGNTELIEVLLEDLSNDVQDKESLEIIQTSVQDIKDSHQRINDIIKNMKTFLHQSEDSKDFHKLEDVFNSAITFIQNKLKRSPKDINIEIQSSAKMTLINKLKIEQVIINLLKNSIDAINETSKPGPHKIQINISETENNNMVYFDIIDTGDGIQDSEKETFFTPFFTTKEIGEGTGLGLAISKKIMLAHKGDLYFINNPHGAHIRGELPNAEIMSFTENEILHGQAKESKSIRVMAIDDDPKILSLINSQLGQEGYVFIGSSHPQDALKIIQDLNVDVLLVDCIMPELNSTQFTQEIRSWNKKIPIIYISSVDNRRIYLEDKYKLNITDFLEKPFNREELIKKIRQVVSQTKQEEE